MFSILDFLGPKKCARETLYTQNINNTADRHSVNGVACECPFDKYQFTLTLHELCYLLTDSPGESVLSQSVQILVLVLLSHFLGFPILHYIYHLKACMLRSYMYNKKDTLTLGGPP